MKILYNADVLSEKTILLWYTKGKNPKAIRSLRAHAVFRAVAAHRIALLIVLEPAEFPVPSQTLCHRGQGPEWQRLNWRSASVFSAEPRGGVCAPHAAYGAGTRDFCRGYGAVHQVARRGGGGRR